jgi:hypothetical protein
MLQLGLCGQFVQQRLGVLRSEVSNPSVNQPLDLGEHCARFSAAAL